MSTHGKHDHIKNAIRNNIKKSITQKNLQSYPPNRIFITRLLN